MEFVEAAKARHNFFNRVVAYVIACKPLYLVVIFVTQ